MYEKLLEIYKYNQDEHIKKEKFVLRSRKKTISYFYPKVVKPEQRFLMEDFMRNEQTKIIKMYQAQNQMPTFDEIYLMKLEAEQMEKAKQSVFDGKSPSNALLSASNKGMSPRRRRQFFRFGGQDATTPMSSMMGLNDDAKS